MGMDLQPMRPSKDAPKGENGKPKWGRYNWWGWGQLCKFLVKHGVDIHEFSGMNDGDRISAKTCKLVAKTIEENMDEYHAMWNGADKEVSEMDALLWKTCGGYRQY